MERALVSASEMAPARFTNANAEAKSGKQCVSTSTWTQDERDGISFVQLCGIAVHLRSLELSHHRPRDRVWRGGLNGRGSRLLPPPSQGGLRARSLSEGGSP